MIDILIKNPKNSAPADFYFQTFDSNRNMIGNSTTPLSFKANPLILKVSG